MISIHNIFMKLEATASRTEKLSILKSEKDNALLKTICRLAIDPHIQFFIRNIPNYTPSNNSSMSLLHAINELSSIYNRELTGNSAKSFITCLLSTMSANDANILSKIILKDLKCGVSVATVNAVWDNLIKEIPCMLAEEYSTELISKIVYPAISQTKEDGTRAMVIIDNDKINMVSRNGNPFYLKNRMDSFFYNHYSSLKSKFGEKFVLDGEFLVIGNDGNFLPREKGNGILNKAVQDTISDEEIDRIYYVVWDCIPYDNYIDGKCNTLYSVRFDQLKSSILGVQYCGNNNKPFDRIHVVQTKLVHNAADALSDYYEKRKLGLEGSILKCSTLTWDNSRTKKMIKMKDEQECDLKIVGFKKGNKNKKFAKMNASISCESSDGGIAVDVSGIPDDLKQYITDNEDILLDKIVSVKFNSVIKKKGSDLLSLFLPRLVEIRYDKTGANTTYDIIAMTKPKN